MGLKVNISKMARIFSSKVGKLKLGKLILVRRNGCLKSKNGTNYVVHTGNVISILDPFLDTLFVYKLNLF